MKRKIFLVLMVAALASYSANAQLTTGNPSAKEIRTGNRPSAGDFGIFVGVPIDGIIDAVQNYQGTITPFPILNFKYFATDGLELRASLDAMATIKKASGKVEQDKMLSSKGSSKFLLEPGVAYHFTKRSILDVYAGADLLLGTVSNSVREVNEATDIETRTTKSAFSTGGGIYIGLQAFIANLPFAIGVEYGICSQFDFGVKYKNVVTTSGGTQTYYTNDLPDSFDKSIQFSSLMSHRGAIDQRIRFTLSYYFK